jgi:hypothetical protein
MDNRQGYGNQPIDVSKITYKIKDGKRKAVFMGVGSTIVLVTGVALTVVGIAAEAHTLAIIGGVCMLAGIFGFYKTSRDMDDQIDNFTKGFFGEPVK